MTRALDSAVSDEIERSRLRVAHLFYGLFKGANGQEVLALTDASHNIGYGGVLYRAAGQLLQMAAIDESPSIQVNEVTLTLTGLDPALLAIIENYSMVGDGITIWRAILNEQGQVIGAPIQLFKGISDGAGIEPSNTEMSIGLVVRNRLSDFERSSGRRTNHQEHKSSFPDDEAFSFVASTVEQVISW
jgi:hypothetical protein